MAKDSYYFQHDYNARNDPKILMLRSEFGLEGYGIFWCLLETIAEDENGIINKSYIGGLSVGYGVAIDKLKKIIKYCVNVGLLKENKDSIYSERMNKHKEMRKSLSDSGRIGAEKRWGGHSSPNAKERKGNENKVNDIPTIEEFLNHAKTLEIYRVNLDFAIKAKYKTWIDDGWKDGNGNKIKNWKNKLSNTLPHLKASNITSHSIPIF